MEGTIDQLNFEVLIKDDQFKEKVNADLALAKELNVQLSTLLDLQSKMPKTKISSGASSADSNAALRRAKEEEALAKAISGKVVADERAKKAIADREAAENRAVAALGKLEEADNRVAKSASDAAAAAERAAKATTERITAEINAETALTKKGTAETQALKEAVKLAEAEEKKAAAAAKRQREETNAAAAISKKATEEQRLRKETAKAAEAEEKAAKAVSDRAAAESRAAKASAQAAKAQLQLREAMKKTNTTATSQSRLLGELKSMAMMYFSIRGGWQLIQSLVRITGEFELQKTALGAMIGDLTQAKMLVADIQELAVKSPFAFKELTSYTKQLAAFSVPTDELFETTKMLADVSAGLGVGMDRIILAYGQIRSAAFLRGQEVRQLTEAGIPVLEELAKQFEKVEGRAVSAGEVFDKISARLVPFEMVEKIFKDMTSEGGKFYEMQELQAETLRGKVMNLKDAYEMMMNEIGSDNDSRLKGAVDMLRNMMQNWERTGAILKTIIITYGSYKAAVLAVTAAEKVMFAYNRVKAWQRLQSILKATNRDVKTLAQTMKALGATKNMLLGGVVAAVAALATITITAIKNANKLNKELAEISSTAKEGMDKSVSEMRRLVEALKDAKEGTQEYRDIISELNRRYDDYLPKLLDEADGYNEVALAAGKAEQAIRNKARADVEAEGRAAIEKEFGKALGKSGDVLYNWLTGASSIAGVATGITGKVAQDIKAAFDTALLRAGAEDSIEEIFEEVVNRYLGDENAYDKIVEKMRKVNPNADDVFIKAIKQYAEVRMEIDRKLDNLSNELERTFGTTYSSKAERQAIEEIEQAYRDALNALAGVKQSKEAFEEKQKELQIRRLESLAAYYENRLPEKARMYTEQAKALKDLQEGWKGVVNASLKAMQLEKKTSFGLWTDEYTQSVKYVEDLVSRYQEINKEMALIESFDTDMAKNLEQNKKAIEAVAKALGIDIQAIIESKKKGGKNDNPELEELKAQINMVKKLKQSYEELRDFLDDDQMRRILKSLFPNAKEDWLKNFDFDAVLLKMAEELEKYDTQAASSLRDSIGKDAAKDLSDLFEAFMKYKEAVDDWKAEDFNFYGGDEVGKILRDLSKEYESIEKKRRNTLELLRKAEAGDAEAIALLRTTLGEEVWKKYVTEGKAAIEELANAEKEVAYKEAEDKAKEKASEILKKRMEEENIDLTDFADKSVAQVRTLLDRLTDIKNDIQAEIILLYRGGLTEDEKIRLAELTEELELVGKQAADTGEELDKKIGDALKKIASQTSKVFSNLGKEISEFGKLLDAPMLENLGEQFSEMASFAGDFAGKVLSLSESLKGVEPGTAFKDLSESVKGGIIAVAATAVVAVFKQMKNAITSYIQHQDLLNEKLYEYRDLMLELRREDFSNIFGTDEMALAAENARILTEAQERYNATLDKMKQKKSMGASLFVFGKDGEKIKSVMDMLEEISGNQGWNLYDQNGMIDIDALEMYYETFKKSLSRKQRKLVEELIENGKAYYDAAAQQAEYLTDLFSGVADSIADSMVEAFIESGNAAIDMGEIMSDVAKTMVANLIKSMFIKDVLDKYEQSIKDAWQNDELGLEEKTKLLAGTLSSAMSEIEGLTPEITAMLKEFLPYLDMGGEDEDKTLGAGIKGITEDTANLLASYLNAIRADVSYSREIWERMDVSMQQIAAALAGFSAPSLMEYQAKIESNTYNTMLATQSILSNLQSVMDYEGGTAAIRVS